MRGQFWEGFKQKFPTVHEYLGPYADGDCNNNLAGLLSLTGDGDDEPVVVDGEIRYEATVWHFANWDLFIQFIEKKFGARRRAGWISEEDLNPYASIEV